MKRMVAACLVILLLAAGFGCTKKKDGKLTINTLGSYMDVYREAAEEHFSDVGAVELNGFGENVWVTNGTRYLMAVSDDKTVLEALYPIDGAFAIAVYDGGTGGAEVSLKYSIGDDEACVIQRGSGTINLNTKYVVKLESADPAERAKTIMAVVYAALVEVEGE